MGDTFLESGSHGEPAEWTNTFRLLSTVRDDDEFETAVGDDSVVIVLQDSAEDQLRDAERSRDAPWPSDAEPPPPPPEDMAAESKRRRWREMPLYMRSSVDGSRHSGSGASMSGRGPLFSGVRTYICHQSDSGSPSIRGTPWGSDWGPMFSGVKTNIPDR